MAGLSDLSQHRGLLLPGHVLAWLLMLGPLAGFLLVVAIPGPGGAIERARLFGIVVDSGYWLFIGLFVGTVLSTIFVQRRLHWTYAVISGILAFVFILALPFFILDVIQVRPGVREEARRLYDVNMLRNLVALTAYSGFLGALAVTSIRSLLRSRVPESGPGLVRPAGATSGTRDTIPARTARTS